MSRPNTTHVPSHAAGASSKTFICLYLMQPSAFRLESREFLDQVFKRAGVEREREYAPSKPLDTKEDVLAFLGQVRRFIRRLDPDIRVIAVFPLQENLDAFEWMLGALEQFAFQHQQDANASVTRPHFSVDAMKARHVLLVGDGAPERWDLLISRFDGVHGGQLGSGGVLLTDIGPCYTLSIVPQEGMHEVCAQSMATFLRSDGPAVQSAIHRRTDSGRLVREGAFSEEEPPTQPKMLAKRASIPPLVPVEPELGEPSFTVVDEHMTIEIHGTTTESRAMAAVDPYATPKPASIRRPLLPGEHKAVGTPFRSLIMPVRMSGPIRRDHAPVPSQPRIWNVPKPADPPTLKMQRVLPKEGARSPPPSSKPLARPPIPREESSSPPLKGRIAPPPLPVARIQLPPPPIVKKDGKPPSR